ncbi:dicarboxylate/amino acid:cation symporter [Fusobacterium sp.]|uniref:dicarboxylate/amino acid:cation symporter n=1 Tax=Fusobacterium sp. TaxID=68766 RepID=UPI0025C027B9|nr:dicarboxylate/amino acid:cation symporter [Fusobacterium sp.]
MKKNTNTLAIKMSIALVLGILAGFLCIFLRERLGVNSPTWKFINFLLFQDISAKGGEKALGLFYIVGQLFINSLQLVIIPMVYTSITLAICHISDTRKLGRISYKTLGFFLVSSVFALILAGFVGMALNLSGAFNIHIESGVNVVAGKTGSNPLLMLIQMVPNNIFAAFSQNGGVLATVFLAVSTGLCINSLGENSKYVKGFLQEINDIVIKFLTFVINVFGPIAIFVLLTRTFAAYGVEHLKPALIYVVSTTITLFLFLIFGYSILIAVSTKLNPLPFVKKAAKVALFGFSTSSSAATLPLNKKTTVEELGVNSDIASFVLPLGMTTNMNGTAIMQVIAAVFVATTAGYDLGLSNIFIIGILALIASVGTPAAPGAGAIVLFTILSGLGYVNDTAILTYSLILAINRPIEMLVTSLNVIGDSAASIYVAKSEHMLDEDVYNK